MDQFDLTKYLDIALRRKYWIVITLLLTLLAGLTYALVAPKTYEAKTLILVQPQKVPQDFVRPAVSEEIAFTLRTIIHQVTSRTNLEKIIREHQLYNEPDNVMTMEEKVALLRDMIKIDLESTEGARNQVELTSFTIAFRDKDPKKTMDVTNELASSFITKYLKMRETHAVGTSSFLSDEVKTIENRIFEKENEIKLYREKYMGGLPDQLQSNLSILERLQAQLDQHDDNLRDEEERRVVIQNQLEDARKNAVVLSSGQNGEAKDLPTLKAELSYLEVRYTQNHPDVVRLKETIAKLERELSELSASPSSIGEHSRHSRVVQTLKQQLQENELRIKSLKADIAETNGQISTYNKRIEETPKREQELLSLRRDYENLMGIYHSLLEKKLAADIALSMERQQKGEQFRILEPASMPIVPVGANIRAMAVLTLVLGLGLGAGLAYTREVMDSTYKTPEELEKELQVPVLVSMPIRYTTRERRIQKIKGILKAASVSVGFVICAIGIGVATKGMDTTLDFAKNLVDQTMITFSPTETSLLTDESQNPPVK